MTATRRTTLAIGVIAVALAVGSPALAQQEQQQPCTEPERRQFDFWVGEWEVRNPSEQVVGSNEITRISNGCGLREEWVSAQGVPGTSLNAYDPATDRWYQTWIGGSGMVLRLAGGLEGESMVMSGALPGPDGGTVTHRITWTPLGPDRVRQHWEMSDDDGATWRTAFDGLYERVASTSADASDDDGGSER